MGFQLPSFPKKDEAWFVQIRWIASTCCGVVRRCRSAGEATSRDGGFWFLDSGSARVGCNGRCVDVQPSAVVPEPAPVRACSGRRRVRISPQVAGGNCDQASQIFRGVINLGIWALIPALAIAVPAWIRWIPGNPFIAARTDSCLPMPRVHQLIESIVHKLIADMTETHVSFQGEIQQWFEQVRQVVHRRRSGPGPSPCCDPSGRPQPVDHRSPPARVADRAHQGGSCPGPWRQDG